MKLSARHGGIMPKKCSFSFFALISLLNLESGIFYIPSFPVWELFTHSKIPIGL